MLKSLYLEWILQNTVRALVGRKEAAESATLSRRQHHSRPVKFSLFIPCYLHQSTGSALTFLASRLFGHSLTDTYSVSNRI